MIVVRSPLRISLGGGGTDIPSYYSQFGGRLLTAAIDKYVYVSLVRPFEPGIYLKYSEIERCNEVSQVSHPIIREALSCFSPNLSGQIEITTLADIPSGTRLGSSGSFTTALLKSLHEMTGHHLSARDLAELACDIEINKLDQPVGKQDQYAAAYGGINVLDIEKNGDVFVTPLGIEDEVVNQLNDNLLLFFTGFSRSANEVLSDQDSKTKSSDLEMLENLHFTKSLGMESEKALLCGDMAKFGRLMNVHWEHKRARSGGMTNTQIDNLYQQALKSGALGGKLVGAGGGGFLMFIVEDAWSFRKSFCHTGLREVRFSFDYRGTVALDV